MDINTHAIGVVTNELDADLLIDMEFSNNAPLIMKSPIKSPIRIPVVANELNDDPLLATEFSNNDPLTIEPPVKKTRVDKG